MVWWCSVWQLNRSFTRQIEEWESRKLLWRNNCGFCDALCFSGNQNRKKHQIYMRKSHSLQGTSPWKTPSFSARVEQVQCSGWKHVRKPHRTQRCDLYHHASFGPGVLFELTHRSVCKSALLGSTQSISRALVPPQKHPNTETQPHIKSIHF